MFFRVKKFVQHNQNDIILFMVVFLICLLSFAIGYLIAKYQQKEPLKFEETRLFFQGMESAMRFFSITVRSMNIAGSGFQRFMA